MRRQLFIMVKEPFPGRVKSRLGRDIGMVPAAWWFRHQAAGLIRRVGRDSRWRTVIAVTPDVQGLASRVWPPGLPRWPQGNGDLGQRMWRIFRFAEPGPVVIIGADVPDINAARVASAFRCLGNHDAVLGPAADGGYWAIGMKRQAPLKASLFHRVRWSTAHALRDTRLAVSGWRGDARVAYIDQLADVDELEDLSVVRRPLRRPFRWSGSGALPQNSTGASLMEFR